MRSSILVALFLLASLAIRCGKDSSPAPDTPVNVEFGTTTLSVTEGQKGLSVELQLSKPLPDGKSLKIVLLPGSGIVSGDDADLYTSPSLGTESELIFEGPASSIGFLVNTNFDTKSEAIESAVFRIMGTEGVEPGVDSLLTVSIEDGTLDSELVAEYVFNGNLDDTSGKGHHGTNHGATLTTGKYGKPNSAYLFSGSDYVTVANNVDINFGTNQNFTVSVWAEPAAIQNDMSGTINDILRAWMGDIQGYPFGISYYNSSNTTAPRVFAGARYDGTVCGHVPEAFSGTVSSQFHHVVLRKDGTSLSLYVDGGLVQTVMDNTSCSTTNSSNLYIGCRGNLLRCFTGKIDDLRIYNRVLSSTEITALYNMP